MADIYIDRKSAEDLIDFWNNYVINMELVNGNTARSLGAASKAILSVEENWEKLDITDIDTDRIFQKFAVQNARKYKPRTLDVYRRRFNRAIADYLNYLNNPSGWKGPSANRSPSSKSATRKKKNQVTSRQMSFLAGTQALPSDPNLTMITHNFRLRENCIIQLRLPADLNEADVKRLTAFLDLQVLPTNSSEE
jgi:hypothetical protein